MNANEIVADSTMMSNEAAILSEFNSRQMLVCVPQPEPFESPTSWLSRMALNQGVTVWEVLAYLKIKIDGDVDIEFALKVDEKIAQMCGLQLSSFSFMKHMFTQLSTIDADGSIFLLSYQNRARYRFCSRCLSEQQTPHVPLHWRFKAWRWCPLHNCLLSDLCPHCKSVLKMPQNLMDAGPQAKGVAYLSRCTRCNKSLTSKSKKTRFPGRERSLKLIDHRLLSNGRALLAAIYRGEFCLGESPHKYPLSQVCELAKNGQLPHGVMRYETLDPDFFSFALSPEQ
jgi:TniQ